MPQAPTPVKRYHETLLQTVRDIGLHQKWFTSPINLGGVGGAGGGSGIPIGGIIGQLIQTKVAYDTTESIDPTLPTSGRSLVHNLNRIRYNITQRSKRIVVLDETTEIASGVRVIDFQGAPVTVTLASGFTDRVIVTISGTGGGESESGVLVKVTANDTLANYLDSEIAEGTKITTTVLNPGGNEQLEIAFDGLNLTEIGDVTIVSPADNEVLAYNTGSNEFINQTPAEASLSAVGHSHVETDITDLDHDAVKLRTRNISTVAPTDGQTYRWDSGASEWVPSGVVSTDEKIGEIQQAGVSKATAVSIMNFKGTAVNEIIDQGGGKVDIDLSASGTGATEFTGLTDTPSSYSGEGGKSVLVNSGETALEFGDAAGAGGSDLELKDEGTILTSSGTSINFVGDAVTATVDGTKATVSIPGLLVDVPEFIGTRILLKTDTQVNTGDFWTDINWENNGVEVYAEPSSFIFAGGDLRVPEIGYYVITFQETITGSPLPADANRNFAPHLDFNNIAIAIDQGIRVTTDLQTFDVSTAYFFNSTTTNIRVVTFNEGHNESIYPTMVSGYFTHITIHKIAASTLGIRAVRTVQLNTVTIATGTETDVEWKSDNGSGGGHDTDDFWSTANRSEFTIPASGYYSVQAQITWDKWGGGTDRRFWVEINGSNIIAEANTKHPGPNDTNSLQQLISTSYFFNEGDTVKFRIWHDRGENLNILTGNIFGSEANANITQIGRP